MSTVVLDAGALSAALRLARGCYQRGLLRGEYRLSGSDLAGKARRYSGHYARSREALLGRCRAAGIAVGERRGARGLRVLVFGAEAPRLVATAMLAAEVLTCTSEGEAARYEAALIPLLVAYEGGLTASRDGTRITFGGVDAPDAADVVFDARDADDSLPAVRLAVAS